jgi:undecaprenyl-diphosphatase
MKAQKHNLNAQLPDQPDEESRSSIFEPSPEAKAAAEPARKALKEALSQIKTPEQASEAAAIIAATSGNETELEVRAKQGASPQPGAEVAENAAETPQGAAAIAQTLLTAAQQVAGSSGETREAIEQVLQEVTRTAQGDGDPDNQSQLNLLRGAILKRMRPFKSVDTRLFLAINHLPHPHLVNKCMNMLTIVMNGGWGWVLGLFVAAIFDRPRGQRAFHQVVPPLWFATMTIEYPVKSYFRRRRPFIDVVQAIAVGRKPGSYSFPSGHSAAAFAGAWLIHKHYPAQTPLWYAIAALVGFSRIYVGAHYPGDVLSGAVAGTCIAEATRWFIDQSEEGNGALDKD